MFKELRSLIAEAQDRIRNGEDALDALWESSKEAARLFPNGDPVELAEGYRRRLHALRYRTVEVIVDEIVEVAEQNLQSDANRGRMQQRIAAGRPRSRGKRRPSNREGFRAAPRRRRSVR